MIQFLDRLSRLLSILLVASVVLFVAFKIYYGDLPRRAEIVDDVMDGPVQELHHRTPFPFAYRKKEYVVEPQADYEIAGLIVTHNDIHSLFDSYHSNDSVDVKDLCVIWGRNVGTEAYLQIKFWSAPWTCFYQLGSEAGSSFDGSELSNNHILSPDPMVRKIVNSARIGDQIWLRGMLVDYYPKGYSEQRRRTSLTREDTGDGACEVFLVDEARILKRFRPEFYGSVAWAEKLIPGLLFLKGILLFFLPYLRYRYT